MAFVNEYIPEADYQKYDLRRVIGDQNPFQPGYLFAREWTIDRGKEVFFTQIWTHREAEFDGFALYWRGEWMFFEMRIDGMKKNAAGGFDWIGYLVKGFSIPTSLEAARQELTDTFEQALSVYCGAGVFSSCSPCAARVTYIAKQGGN